MRDRWLLLGFALPFGLAFVLLGLYALIVAPSGRSIGIGIPNYVSGPIPVAGGVWFCARAIKLAKRERG